LGTRTRVLVVDDSRATRAYVIGALREAGDFVVEEASSGFEALRICTRADLDVIISDINMPDINGLELLRFVKQNERNRSAPFIIISTQASPRDRERMAKLGASAFLAKPFAPADLLEALQKVLGGAPARGEP
jgi:two-component system, chemotaxis family, chemotaxis protein CheY